MKLDMDVQSNDTLRVKELVQQLDVKNGKIEDLQKELEVCRKELNEQIKKTAITCEARDEYKFEVVHLRSEITTFKKESVLLKAELKENIERKNSREVSLEKVVETYINEIKKYEEKIKEYIAKIAQLENENIGMHCTIPINVSNLPEKSAVLEKDYELKISELEEKKKELEIQNEKYRNEMKILQGEREVKLHAEKKANVLLQQDLENLKILCNKSSSLENSKTGAIHFQEMKNLYLALQEDVFACFAAHRGKFELETSQNLKFDKVTFVEEVKVQELSKKLSPSPLKQLNCEYHSTPKNQEVAIPEKVKEIKLKNSKPKPQNKKLQQRAESEKLDPGEASSPAIVRKKYVRKNKKEQNENKCLSAPEKNGRPQVDSSCEPDPAEKTAGRTLRSKRK